MVDIETYTPRYVGRSTLEKLLVERLNGIGYVAIDGEMRAIAHLYHWTLAPPTQLASDLRQIRLLRRRLRGRTSRPELRIEYGTTVLLQFYAAQTDLARK